jgi:hypothetical protein
MTEFAGSLRVHNPVATKAPLYVRAAERKGTLAGKRIGLIWNGKPGGNHALEVAAEHIAKRFPDATFTDGQLQQIVDHCDVAIGTTGD